MRREDLEEGGVILALQGRIVAEWAELLERECAELQGSGLRVELDLSEIVFVGCTGLEALSRLSRSGIRISACPPLIAALLAHEEGIATDPFHETDEQEERR